MNLKDIIVNTKEVKVEFPNSKGFIVTIGAISREISRKLKTESEVTKYNKQYRQMTTELDEEIFAEKFAEYAIKGWEGLTMGQVKDLVLVNYDGSDDDILPYTPENAVYLLKNSQEFDNWINEMVFDIEQFRN